MENRVHGNSINNHAFTYRSTQWPSQRSQPAAKVSPFSTSNIIAASINNAPRLERIQAATELLSEAFNDDPTVNYILDSVNPNQRDTYLPSFFRAVLTVAAANGATFDEIGGWKSCGVICPPGSAVDRIGPSLYPMVISVAWSIGFRGCQASPHFQPHSYLPRHPLTLRPNSDYSLRWRVRRKPARRKRCARARSISMSFSWGLWRRGAGKDCAPQSFGTIKREPRRSKRLYIWRRRQSIAGVFMRGWGL